MKLTPLQPFQPLDVNNSSKADKKNVDTGFGEVLKKSIDAVNTHMQEADRLTQGLASGEHGNIHETMIAIEKAGISFRLMTKMQQKAITAYQDIMRIQM